jgi:hypothetical protein
MFFDTPRGAASRRRLIAAATSLLLVVGLLASTAGPVAAVTVKRTWTATIPTYGTSSVAGLTTGPGQLAIHLSGLQPSTDYAVAIVRGTCAKPGTRVVSFSATKSTGAGLLDREGSISNTGMNKLWEADRTGTGRVSIQIGTGSLQTCGDLRYVVATRVVFPYVKINLPIIRQNNTAFPYCGVAMYLPVLGQPAEPWATMIYSHARTGMFLPLLTASRVSNGSGMLGRTIDVYTSDSMRYVYTVTNVLRHLSYITGLDGPLRVTTQKIYLQTSEGPLRSSPKLFVIGTLTGVYPTTYALSHPAPHPRVCH